MRRAGPTTYSLAYARARSVCDVATAAELVRAGYFGAVDGEADRRFAAVVRGPVGVVVPTRASVSPSHAAPGDADIDKIVDAAADF